MSRITIAPGIEVSTGAWNDQSRAILTPEFLSVLKELHTSFQERRVQLLASRKQRQIQYDQGRLPQYLDSQSEAAIGSWKVADIPEDLKVRRVEITGPVNDPKMVINMLSRNDNGDRADMAMLDFEDSMMPSWNNVISGVHNVIGASQGSLEFHKKDAQGNILKTYSLDKNDMAGVMMRVRGLHLNESNLWIDGAPVSGGLFDLAACFFHAAKHFIANQKTPKFYVPKVEHFLEARWWNALFTKLETLCGYDVGTLRATFLIETLTGAFQVEEILFELKDHIAGLNVGRWDKIFSDIKILKTHTNRITADRSEINMQKFWMDNYAKRLIKICHARGAYAIGGMSACTPGKEPEVREQQTAKVKADKQYEFDIGHDGCWVSHPYFIGPAMSCFVEKNQMSRSLDSFPKYPNLVMEGSGPRTLAGLRKNIRVGIAYMEGWSRELGCIAWDNLMEDLATLEISRTQVWQWLYHSVTLESGEVVDRKLISQIFREELETILSEFRSVIKDTKGLDAVEANYTEAARIAEELFTTEHLPDFLTCDSPICEPTVNVGQASRSESLGSGSRKSSVTTTL